jgi:hypothetical protein
MHVMMMTTTTTGDDDDKELTPTMTTMWILSMR